MDKSWFNKIIDGDIKTEGELPDELRSVFGLKTRDKEYKELAKGVCLLWVQSKLNSSDLIERIIAKTLMVYLIGDDPFKSEQVPIGRPLASFEQKLYTWAYSRKYSQVKASDHFNITRGAAKSRIDNLMNDFEMKPEDWDDPTLQPLVDFAMRIYERRPDHR